MITFSVNGKQVNFDGDTTMPLLWYLREELKFIGTKFGCGIGSCGACTVHIGQQAIRSCSLTMAELDGQNITTIEGLAKEDEELHPVQQAWIDFDVPQCGYCQAGQIMAITNFLKDNPAPTDEDIDEGITNLCRCGTYTRMRKAIHHAAALMAKKGA